MKILRLLFVLLFAWATNAEARPRGIAGEGTLFNGGKFLLDYNFPGIDGAYPFTNQFKNTSGDWSLVDSQGAPLPNDFDVNGYPTSASDSILNHSGVQAVVRIPAEAYIGNNCIPATTGICFVALANGIGTVILPGTIQTSNVGGGTSTVNMGTSSGIVTITFSQAQDFRAGMEVPIAGTTGTITLDNATGTFTSPTGAQTAWTVCAANLTTTQIQLCLGDQTTSLLAHRTGALGGTTAVTYGRKAVGVASKGRIVFAETGSPVSFQMGISAQDATTPITYRNNQDGLALITQGSEETRYMQYVTGICDSCQFGASHLAKVKSGNPGVVRSHGPMQTSKTAQEVNWADRKPVGYYSFGAFTLDRPGGVYVGRTSSNGSLAYTTSLGGATLADHQQYTFAFDGVSVTAGNDGSGNLQITQTGHPFVTGKAIRLYFTLPGGSAPGNTSAGTTYFAVVTGANTYQLATTLANALAGTPVIAYSSAGANVRAHQIPVVSGVTFPGGGGTSITWNNNLLSVGDQVSCGVGTLPTEINNFTSYYVKTATTNAITISKTNGGSAITFATAGSGNSCVQDPTINVNGSGVVAIHDLYGFGLGLSSSTRVPSPYGTGGTLVYGNLTYDKLMNVWLKYGADVSLGTQYFNSGWPPETWLSYAKAIGAHPWYTPTQYSVDGYTDPATHAGGASDFYPSLMKMVRDNKPSWMVPRFEAAPNENWNNAFPATAIGLAHAWVYSDSSVGNSYYAGWTSNSINAYVGKVASVSGQMANQVFGGAVDSSKYEIMVGAQGFNFAFSTGAANNAERLTSSNYMGQTAGSGQILSGYSQFTLSAAKDWFTHVTTAGYISSAYNSTVAKGIQLAAAYSGGVLKGSIATPGICATSTLTVTGWPRFNSATNLAIGTAPDLDAGTTLQQGPGVTPGTKIMAFGTSGSTGTGQNGTYCLDTNNGTVPSNDIDYTTSTSDATAAQTFLDGYNYSASFNGDISGSTLTVRSSPAPTGFITVSGGSGGDFVTGSGVDAYTQVRHQLTGTTQTAQFTGSIATGSPAVMTVTAMTSGSIGVTNFIGGVANDTYVTKQLTGTAGCPAPPCTYALSVSQTVASGALTSYVGGQDGTYSLVSTGTTVTNVAMHSYGVFSVPAVNTAITNAVAYAQSYTNKDGHAGRYAQYEGSYSNDFIASGLGLWDQLVTGGEFVSSSTQWPTGTYGVIGANTLNNKTAGGEFPALFQFSGVSPANNVWSALNDLYQPAPTYVWNAFKDCAGNGNC